ncbi:hypothetical protein LUZ61_015180 [Rhynchospora tenuis]|uniref:Uncharacterized protein n=1 Tax=Rhynchospora tenuis TaxID=198213 RepID=A0AAD5Z3I6_9POAL|nr:hypothetical protein LUZ61_015180 [Rhynchospora tenuis]
MVEVLESCFVVPSDETPKGRLWLSNLDQVAPREFVGFVHVYRNTDATNFFSVEVLKAALSKALVLFYPLSGRYAVGSDGRLVLDCNGEGCFFVRARLERAIDSINIQPSPELERLFVPSIEMAGSKFVMLMIQVTYMKCGGVVLGFAFNHILGDARCNLHFIRTWASITRGDLSSIAPPSFDRTPLRARTPPTIKFDHPEYIVEPTIRSTLTGCTTTKFLLTKEQVRSLKTRCNNGSVSSVSSFCAVVSLVWKCYCDAQSLVPDTTANLMFTVGIRDRLKPPLSKYHFSNAIVRRSVQSKVSELTSNPLHVVAEQVKVAIDSVNDEYVRSLIDYLEIVKNQVFATMKVPESHLRVTSISRMPVYDADFGCGEPDLVSRWKVSANRVVYISDEPGVKGGMEVVITVDSTTMHRFEKMFAGELYAGNENISSGLEINRNYQIGQSKL